MYIDTTTPASFLEHETTASRFAPRGMRYSRTQDAKQRYVRGITKRVEQLEVKMKRGDDFVTLTSLANKISHVSF